MSILHAIILGIIQGVTEFIPVSSSGHLFLYESFFNLPEAHDKSFDIVLHAGTLIALLIYFWPEWIKILKTISCVSFSTKTCDTDDNYLLLKLLIAMIPTVLLGFLLRNIVDIYFRESLWIGLFMVMMGIIYILAEYNPAKNNYLGLRKSLAIGIAQGLAVLPGISRSGATISTAMFFGIDRVRAAKFSFLLAFPTILGANIVTFYEFFQGNIELPSLLIITVGFVSSAIVSFVCIKFLMNYLKNHSLRFFSYYLIVVGMTITLITYV